MPRPEPQHIGDGVYVSFDGYHLNIAVNHHTNHVVALEPRVFGTLVDYAQAVNDEYGTNHFVWPEAKDAVRRASPESETPAA